MGTEEDEVSGAILKVLFTYARLTSKEIGNLTRHSDAFIRALSTGARPLKLPHAVEIARALGADVASLVKGPIPLEWDGKTPYNFSSYEKWRIERDDLKPSELEQRFAEPFDELKKQIRLLNNAADSNPSEVWKTIELLNFLKAKIASFEGSLWANNPHLRRISQEVGPMGADDADKEEPQGDTDLLTDLAIGAGDPPSRSTRRGLNRRGRNS